MSADGTTVAIGAIQNDDNGSNTGHVRVHRYSEGDGWKQLGGDIGGEASKVLFGYSVSMSSDGESVAIGAPGNGNGHVRVYRYDDSTGWVQLGGAIDGVANKDRSGNSVSLSADGTRIAIGADRNNGNGKNAGHVRVHQYDLVKKEWGQLGVDIDGEAKKDFSGYSVAMSADGTTVAIGAIQNDDNGSNTGHVRVYRYSEGNGWKQLGGDIGGEASNDLSGYSVALSEDGTTVAIGAPANVDLKGHVRIYYLINADDLAMAEWSKIGEDIDGLSNGDLTGSSVAISLDGTTVAVGAPGSNGFKGRVRVYEVCGLQYPLVLLFSVCVVDFRDNLNPSQHVSFSNFYD
jgi:hypothetical protein